MARQISQYTKGTDDSSSKEATSAGNQDTVAEGASDTHVPVASNAQDTSKDTTDIGEVGVRDDEANVRALEYLIYNCSATWSC